MKQLSAKVIKRFFMEKNKKGTTFNSQKTVPYSSKVDGESSAQEAIAAMQEPYRAMGERLHEIIKVNAPALSPRTWYGMPAYANKDGKVVCFFRSGDKFKERYMTLGFNQDAKLDEGHMWPVAFAITGLTGAEEARIVTLVKKAIS
jgi:uncharacterized protein YdhG (YjbR/CyaY superfamily)